MNLTSLKCCTAGAQPLATLLGILRMVLCTDAADVAAGLVVDLYPVVAGALSVEMPVVADSTEATDANMAGADEQDEVQGTFLHNTKGRVRVPVMLLSTDRPVKHTAVSCFGFFVPLGVHRVMRLCHVDMMCRELGEWLCVMPAEHAL